MAINPLQLPSSQAFTPDITPSLANLVNTVNQGQERAFQRQTLADLGKGIANGTLSYDQAAGQLLAAGDRTGALSLAQLGMNKASQQYQHSVDARNFDFREKESIRQQHNTDESLGLQKRALEMKDTPPGFAAAPSGGLQPISGGPADPSYIAQKDAATNRANFMRTVEERKNVALANGLEPSSPGFQSYVLTGKMPREDAQPLTATDKKAILEADETVMSTRSAIDGLRQAKVLSKNAFEGPSAGPRGYAASFLGESSAIGKGGIATTELNNLITTNALSQLKAVFGGMPTEGERKILLEVQGSVNMPDSVRQKIYDRAIQMAESRMKFNQQRADAMRGGSYYKKEGAVSSAPVAQTQGITQAQYEALPSGSVFTAPDGTQRRKP